MAKVKEQLTPAGLIKEICPLFAAIGVTKIEAEYDGSGDSGDFNGILFRFDDPAVHTDSELLNHSSLRNSGSQNTMYMDQFKRAHCTAAPDKPAPIVTIAHMEQLQEAMWQLLPGGWEINEGSFGAIVIDVLRRNIKREHNERIVEIDTTNIEW